ncbi:hypothetical protein COEREDRAFT_80447 [Coemansia reversa NRRL 1564]|uniref:Uncharacterized protein n=1 Tax=Coemansia reversa (strain ATCC 12441 / NRRL 1564) TaxID=763665 RepID=A0A2G5BEI4_COERN|nr:hypothetical protein COEREDRAFT_80447 [Coemansia reversa NRRL 1564]|eukprot:PIA17436.1 hypothetical protein COEREDRAFT_80447 [Coemansia reversa NRRL 1564]
MTRSSRAKSVNYYEETYGSSEESDFQLSEAEESPKKKKTKVQNTSKAADKRPASKTTGKPRTISKESKVDGDNERKLENEDTLLIEPDPADADEQKPADSNTRAALGDDNCRTTKGGHSTTSGDESDVYNEGHDTASDSDEYVGSDGNDSDVVIDVVVGKEGTEKNPAKRKPASAATNSKSRGSKTKTAGTGSKKGTARTPAPAVKKTAVITSSKIVRPTVTTTVMTQLGSAKRNVALGSLLSSPNTPRVTRPKLPPAGSTMSSTSSSSLSASLASPVRSPSGIKRRVGGASLKDLLKGSNVPRAGLTRRAPLRKVI